MENLQEMLKTFLYEKLDVQNRLTYDILEYYLELMADDAEYILYDEPLGWSVECRHSFRYCFPSIH